MYAEYIGCAPDALSFDNLFANPAGLVIDGKAWVRQVVPPVHDRGAITLGCAVAEGAELYFLKPRLGLVGHLRQEIVLARAELGQIRGALLFDCALRRLELEATHMKDTYARLIEFPAAGFHTHGESWLGHMHQTLTAIYFG
ncbi:MAG TPA: FIST C-terminal domain-containing protein [Polyangia bacterium]|nr:FIST C-terminal domain-containing protein [Polyangia bacterium]